MEFRCEQSGRSSAGTICVLGVLIGSSSAAATPVAVGMSGWIWGNPTPQGNTLKDVVFRGVYGFAVGDLGTVLRSEDDGTTWTELSIGIFAELSSMQEIDPDTVFIDGECSVGIP
jgi:photosystem II stability/assembly factor-like uncharacterized protein